MTDDWLEAMDQGLYTGAMFLHLRKAFDVVNHDVLQMYGCSSSTLWLLWLHCGYIVVTVVQKLLVRPSTVCQHCRNLS